MQLFTRVRFPFTSFSQVIRFIAKNSWMLNLVQMLLDGNKRAIQFFDKKFEGDGHFAKPPKCVRVITRTFKFSSFSALFEDSKWFRETRLSIITTSAEL